MCIRDRQDLLVEVALVQNLDHDSLLCLDEFAVRCALYCGFGMRRNWQRNSSVVAVRPIVACLLEDGEYNPVTLWRFGGEYGCGGSS